ncbi:hypothetical protein OEA41_002686 [Lepraria neglecta]|uniref:CCHC-type domain-containing protein n=1 Tax=Lepraria neglecta TaxID=209136 RepID=A0AAE0DIN7_9LECA|nr:hypothetical protein OEA41_002686 [Lepraria neglecta]
MSWNDTDAGGDFGGGAAAGEIGGDFTCRKCGEAGHKARECPTDPEGPGKCFNCGEDGHNKADCPNPRVFTGTCRICDKQGHPAAECPDKPPVKCFNCKEEGHQASECKERRVFDKSGIADMSPDDAWTALQKADQDCDLDDFRVALKVYSKAVPDVTYDDLERAFRLNNFNVYLIATEKELPKTHTYVSLQGELDKTYQVGFYFSDKPKRETQKSSWPENAEENLERLKNAGMPMDRGIPKCTRCDELGHTTRGCTEEAVENSDKVEVNCVNCEEIGHRARDCTVPRKDKFACRNCKQSGHTSAECTEPRSAEGVECRKCNEMGHFSKDCPTGGGNACRNCGEEGHMSKECDKPRNPATVTCRNCEEMGHFSKECPKPRDYSKVKCQNCGESMWPKLLFCAFNVSQANIMTVGHTKVRCKDPAAEGDGGFDAPAGGDSFDAPVAEGGDNWESGGGSGGEAWGAAPAATAAGRGW